MLSSHSPGIRKWISALVGGGVGALTWAYLMGFEGIDLAKAFGIGSCALVVAEFASGIVRPGWREGMLWGIAGGIVVGIGGLLLFPIEDAAKHIVVAVFALTTAGVVGSVLRERSARKDSRS